MVKNTTEKATAAEQRHTNEQKYKGVRKRKWGKWVSEIRLPNSRERIWLGSFDSPVKAARAFDAAMYCLRGRTANFNFPDNPPEIPGGRSLTSSEIQIAAARFANTEESVGGESDLSMHEHDMSHAEQMERSRSQSPSSSVLSEGTFVQMETESGSGSGSGSGLEFHSGTYGNMLTKMDSGNFASDFGLFPEFDYMNMGNEFSTTEDYICEENFDVNVDNYLWNF